MSEEVHEEDIAKVVGAIQFVDDDDGLGAGKITEEKLREIFDWDDYLNDVLEETVEEYDRVVKEDGYYKYIDCIEIAEIE